MSFEDAARRKLIRATVVTSCCGSCSLTPVWRLWSCNTPLLSALPCGTRACVPLPAWGIPNGQENYSFWGLFFAFCLAVWFDRLVSPTGESFLGISCDGHGGCQKHSAPDWGRGKCRRAGAQRKACCSRKHKKKDESCWVPVMLTHPVFRVQCSGCWDERSPSFGVLLQRNIVLVAPPALLGTSTAANSPWVLSVPRAWSAGFNSTCGLTLTPTDRGRAVIIHQKGGIRWKRSHCLQVERTSCFSGPEEEELKPCLTRGSWFSRARSPWVYRCSPKPYGSCSSSESKVYN